MSATLTKNVKFACLCLAVAGSAAALASWRGLPEAARDSLPSLDGEAALAYLEREGLHDSLAETLHAARYRAEPLAEEGFRFVNALNGFQAAFEADRESGIRVSSGDEDSEPELTMRLTGYGYGSRLIGLTRESTRAHENRVEHLHRPVTPGSAAVTEWFVNGPEGVEHGFVLPEPPAVAQDGEILRLEIEIGDVYRAELDPQAGSITLEGKVTGAVFTYDKLHVFDARGRALESNFELEGKGLAIAIDDREAVYPLTIDPLLARQTKLTAADAAAEDWFGYSIAMSGNTVVIGAPKDDVVGTDEGSAYIFVRSGDAWTQEARLNAFDGMDGDTFGFAVAIHRDTVVVGAPGNDEAGTAYVWVRDNATWIFDDKLVPATAENVDAFGSSIAISGDTLLVGAPRRGSRGAAFVFVRRAGVWTEQAELPVPSRVTGVALDAETAVIGAGEDEVSGTPQGSAYVFIREGSTWTEQSRLNAHNGAPLDYFGFSVAVSGDTILVGAPLRDNDSGSSADEGAVFAFVRNGVLWTEQQKLRAADGASGDLFGFSVALLGDTAVVGASGRAVAHEDQGAAYVFARINDDWSQQQRLFAPGGKSGNLAGNAVAFSGDTVVLGIALDNVDGREQQGSAIIFKICRCETSQQRLIAQDRGREENFGSSVAVSQDTLVIGAPGSFESKRGAAYVFMRSGTRWIQQQKLVADDGETGDRFGDSVAISGDTVVVGARFDEVGGNRYQGSAYVFVRNGATWVQQQKLTARDGAAEDYFGASVAIRGATVVVGAPQRWVSVDHTQGRAYVFERIGDAWIQRQKLLGDVDVSSLEFGRSVAIGGDTLAVGARQAVHVFVKSGPVWGEQQKLGAAGAPSFGYAVDISGDTIVASSSGTAAAVVFFRNGGAWHEQQSLTPATTDFRASSVAISGDVLVLGDPEHAPLDGNMEQGAALFFVRKGSHWSQEALLVADNGMANDHLGAAVVIGDGVVLAGVPHDNGGGREDQGSVRLFRCRGCPRIPLDPRTLPNATVGSSYNEILTADRGAPPYNYSLSSGTLPPGLTFVPATGLLSGTPTTAGTFRFEVTATDADLCTGRRSYRMRVEDPCPTIRLRPRRLAEGREGEPYHRQLDATGGVAPYEFSVRGTHPPGLTLSSDGILSGTPTADGTFDFEIRATDANGCAGSRAYSLTIETGNQSPVAEAGPDQTAFVNDTVLLDGSGSSDPEGDPLTYLWAFQSRPPGSAASLSNPTAAAPSFVVDRLGAYVLQLVVNDGHSDSSPDFVTITIQNRPPVADAGADQTVTAGVTVRLDGSASADPDGTLVSFSWSLTSRPLGSGAAIAIPAAVNPTFVADLPGVFVVELTVSDGELVSAPDTVTITAEAPVVSLTTTDPDASETGPDPGSFTFLRAGDTSFALTVFYSIDGDAENGADYALISGNITFPVGAVEAVLSIIPVDDDRVEDEENVVLALTDGAAYDLGADASAAVLIADNDPPVVTLTATDPDASEAGPDPGTFLLRRNGPTTRPLTVFYDIDDSGAANGVDYETIAASVTIPAGEATVTVVILPIDDPDIEGREDAVLTLAPGADYVVGSPHTAFVRIADDDFPVVTLTATDDAAETGPDPGTFTVSRIGPVTDALEVFYAIAGDAENGVDYDTIPGSVTIPSGAGTAAVTVTPIDDPEVEGTESVVLSLTLDPAYVVGAPGMASLHIADNDLPVVTLVATDPDATEAGPTTGSFTFSRTGDTGTALQILVSRGGSATSGVDYVESLGASFAFTIPAGESQATLTITPFPDNRVENPDETVELTLRQNLGYVVGTPGTVTITIVDDPPVVNIQATDSVASEAGPNPGVFTFTRTGGILLEALTARFTKSGTATNGSDYVFIGGSVVIPAGQSSVDVTVTPRADNEVEGPDPETVILTLDTSVDYLRGPSSGATVTIADDPAVVSVVATDPDASETGPDPGVFTFTRSGGDVAAALQVLVSRGGSATNVVDYASIGGASFIVTIPSGATSATVTITPVDDPDPEGPETVILTISPRAAYEIGFPASATVTIADNE